MKNASKLIIILFCFLLFILGSCVKSQSYQSYVLKKDVDSIRLLSIDTLMLNKKIEQNTCIILGCDTLILKNIFRKDTVTISQFGVIRRDNYINTEVFINNCKSNEINMNFINCNKKYS